MTHSSQKFSTCSPCRSDKKIAIANGSLTTVAGQGEVHLNKSIVLKKVLHVPKLSTNLVYIHRLTKELNCHVIFYPSHCVFQEQGMGKIGHARKKDGLYYLELSFGQNRTENQVPLSFLSKIPSTTKNKIWLHYCCLGHPSFGVLKIMFPLLFKGIDVEKLHCDVCELAKHRRASFPISNKRVSIPFMLIHSDIWGPTTIPNISGFRWFVSFIDDCTQVTWIFLLKQKSDVEWESRSLGLIMQRITSISLISLFSKRRYYS